MIKPLANGLQIVNITGILSNPNNYTSTRFRRVPPAVETVKEELQDRFAGADMMGFQAGCCRWYYFFSRRVSGQNISKFSKF